MVKGGFVPVDVVSYGAEAFRTAAHCGWSEDVQKGCIVKNQCSNERKDGAYK